MGRWPAMNGMSCAPRAACFMANPRPSAVIGFISISSASIGELEGFAKIGWFPRRTPTFSRATSAVPRLGQPTRAEHDMRVRAAFLNGVGEVLGGCAGQGGIDKGHIDGIMLDELQCGPRAVAHFHATIRRPQQARHHFAHGGIFIHDEYAIEFLFMSCNHLSILPLMKRLTANLNSSGYANRLRRPKNQGNPKD